MKKKNVTHLMLLLLLAGMLCGACKSNEHMYRHNRSHCDCPTF